MGARGAPGVLAAGALIAACGAEAPRPAAPAPAVAPAPASPVAGAPRTYRLSAEVLREQRVLADGVVAAGLRVAYPSHALAEDVADPPLLAGTRVPPELGGGYLFWSESHVYRADVLLGKLQPLFFERHVRRVSFGPTAALVHVPGTRRAVRLPGGWPLSLPMPGLIDFARAGPEAHLALVEPGRLLLANEHGVVAPADPPVVARPLIERDGEVWISEANGRARRFRADGSFESADRVPAEPAPPTLGRDPRWPLDAETPLERAVRRGAPVGDGTALVEAAGAIARVDTRNGKLLDIGRRFLPEGAACRLFPVSADVLAFCTALRRPPLVAAGLASETPRIEKTFATHGRLFFSRGQLVFDGACGVPRAGRRELCARRPAGDWVPMTVPEPAGLRGEYGISRLVPTGTGSVLGLVFRPEHGLLELPSGTFVRFTAPRDERREQALRSPTGADGPVDDAALLASGEIVIGSISGPLRLRRDGSVELTMPGLRFDQRGPVALGVDASGRYLQSLDWGEHWVSVSGPPRQLSTARPTRLECSYVGCDLGAWYRIGFPTEAERPRAWSTAKAPQRPPPPPLPKLRCRAVAVARSAHAPAIELERSGEWLGASRPRVLGPLGLHRALGIPRVALEGAYHQERSGLRVFEAKVSELFAQEAPLRTARGLRPIDVGLLSGSEGALPVASGSGVDGWLVQPSDDPGEALWVRSQRPTRSVRFEGDGSWQRHSAALQKDALFVAQSDGSCIGRVLELGAGGSTAVRLELPQRPAADGCPMPDAFGWTGKGELVVVRFPSGSEPPSQEDPALLIGASGVAGALAPWSELESGNAARCAGAAPDDVRLLLRGKSHWLLLGGVGPKDDSVPGAHEILALLRWSPSRVCLDAIELGKRLDVTVGELEAPSAVSARFDAKPRAVRRAFDVGIEYEEPLRCELAR